MSNIWFTSDWHFGHNKNFLYEPRGFTCVEDMNEAIIERHNSVVDNCDIVYCLGDCLMGDSEKNIQYINALKGKIKIILGNHCTENRIKLYQEYGHEILGYADKIKISRNISFFLCHYPVLTMPRNLDGKLNGRTYSICGHSHTKDKWADWNIGGIYHAELDAHNCYPVHIDQVISDIKEKAEECLSFL